MNCWRTCACCGNNIFQSCHDAAVKFVTWANHQLNELDVDEDLVVEQSLPVKRQTRWKRMDGEQCKDEGPAASDPLKLLNKYRIQVYNEIVDTIVTFSPQKFW